MSKRPGRRFPGASSLAPVLEHAFGRAVIPLGKWPARGGVTVARAADPIEYPAGMPGVRVGQ